MAPSPIPHEILKSVSEYLNRGWREEDDPIVILEEETITRPYGWIFYYESQKYLETREPEYSLVGGGPILCLASGELIELENLIPVEEQLEALEEERGLIRSESS